MRTIHYCRGNSKYHYYGIRIKAESALNRMPDELLVGVQMARRQEPQARVSRFDRTQFSTRQQHSHFTAGGSDSAEYNRPNTRSQQQQQQQPPVPSNTAPVSSEATLAAAAIAPAGGSGEDEVGEFRDYLGCVSGPESDPANWLARYPTPEACKEEAAAHGLDYAHVLLVCSQYKQHCEVGSCHSFVFEAGLI